MKDNYKKLLFALSAIAVVVIIIQLTADSFGSSDLEQNNNNTKVQGNIETDNNLEINNQTQSNSLNTNRNERFTVGSDLTVFEGEPISLKPLITNAISFPAQSLIYNWNQIEGPKINLAEEVKQNKILNFIAPNRPTDTKYVFELKVSQKNSNGNNDFGKDAVNILVLDTNKIAKGSSTTIPSTTSSVPQTLSPNIAPNNNGNGEDGDSGGNGGQFNPNFRD